MLAALSSITVAAAPPKLVASSLSAPGSIVVDSSYAYFADDVVSNGSVTDGSLKRVPVSGGSPEIVVDHTVLYDSGSLRGIGGLALTSNSVIGGYGGYVNLEYEIEPDNPLPGMKQSFAYMRGVLSGLAATPS